MQNLLVTILRKKINQMLMRNQLLKKKTFNNIVIISLRPLRKSFKTATTNISKIR